MTTNNSRRLIPNTKGNRFTIMHVISIFLPLLALANTLYAFPTPKTPDVTAIIRNPVPIDGSKIVGSLLDEINDILGHERHGHGPRAAPSLDRVAVDPVVIVG